MTEIFREASSSTCGLRCVCFYNGPFREALIDKNPKMHDSSGVCVKNKVSI